MNSSEAKSHSRRDSTGRKEGGKLLKKDSMVQRFYKSQQSSDSYSMIQYSTIHNDVAEIRQRIREFDVLASSNSDLLATFNVLLVHVANSTRRT